MERFKKVLRELILKVKSFFFCCLVEDEDEEFSEAQAKEIYLGFKAGLSSEKVKRYARLDLAPFTMFMYRRCMELGKNVDSLITTSHEDWQIAVICRGFLSGMSDKEVKTFSSTELSKEQVGLILKGYKAGLSYSQIKSFAKSHYSLTEMTYRLVCLISENEVSREVAELLVAREGGK